MWGDDKLNEIDECMCCMLIVAHCVCMLIVLYAHCGKCGNIQYSISGSKNQWEAMSYTVLETKAQLRCGPTRERVGYNLMFAPRAGGRCPPDPPLSPCNVELGPSRSGMFGSISNDSRLLFVRNEIVVIVVVIYIDVVRE